jgi:hypothetical protein
MDGQELGDGATQGGAGDVGGVDLVAVQDGQGVGGHVGEGVGVAGEVDDIGLAGIAVVVADDLAMAADQGFHELVGPADGLGGGAHDEENGGVGWVTEAFGPDLQARGINEFLVAI